MTLCGNAKNAFQTFIRLRCLRFAIIRCHHRPCKEVLTMSGTSNNPWPDLAMFDLRPTIDALHLWSQVVGKVRLMLTPWINHSWQATFYLSSRGFATGPIYAQDGRAFEMEFDLLSG